MPSVRPPLPFRVIHDRPRVIVAEEYRHWILGYWARQLHHEWPAPLTRFPLSRRRIRDPSIALLAMHNGPQIVFGHQTLLAMSRRRLWLSRGHRIVTLVTHVNEEGERQLSGLPPDVLARSSFACMNSDVVTRLNARGLNASLVLAGADVPSELSDPWEQREIDVVLSVDAKPRKNLSKALEVLNALDGQAFVFVRNPADASELRRRLRPGVHVSTFDLDTYTKTLGSARCVLSTSRLEGGPMPLIEGLQSGCGFVASSTGFAEELRDLTSVGAVLSPDAPLDDWIREVARCTSGDRPHPQGLEYLSEAAFLRRLIHLTENGRTH